MSRPVSVLDNTLFFDDTRDFLNVFQAKNFLSPDQCGVVRGFWEDESSTEGTIAIGFDQDIQDVRKNRVQWLNPVDPRYHRLTERVVKAVSQVNNEHYGFNIESMHDKLQLTRYVEEEHYGWHVDTGQGALRCRRLGFSVQLSESDSYEGGDLEIMFPEITASRELGSMTVFPSFTPHRVTPVTKGVRFALVGWLSGAPLR